MNRLVLVFLTFFAFANTVKCLTIDLPGLNTGSCPDLQTVENFDSKRVIKIFCFVKLSYFKFL
jgi:hypothetical protein